MNNNEFISKLIDIANNYKTLYIMGCFGAPMTASNKKRYTSNHSYNKKATRTKLINEASADTFGFDCVCLIKGVLWGWNGNKSLTYGGAKYGSNGVPDVGADGMIAKCKDVSTDFSTIIPGEAVWLKGHIGVYIGNGQVVECTPAFKNKVQITNLKNVGNTAAPCRAWTKHGKLPYITYSESFIEPVKDNAVYYIIKKGDTLGKIAKNYKTTVQALLNLNSDKIKNPNVIQVGWKLRVK